MPKPKITLCRAEKKDRPYIEEKLKKYILDATNIDWQQFFVLRNAGKTTAFGRVIDHGRYFELASLGVDYYQRGKGLGLRMLSFLIEQARQLDQDKPIYGVSHRPGFLEKAGFKKVRAYPEYLEYKRNYICQLDVSKIKIMKDYA